ncbi:hypothetical protein DYI95_008855 [Thermaerobacter sp. PB12/4term]|uniref:hypothetical protein n=1 Tax=Thermaerobacter sp. PB12/4term TaxID=2293838 RepID=UPI0011C0395C|nr:hypothetical protein [Thermaerobacter sp. PB12/4term]QIA27612.1 hypothetical protein DYI95_008855 [Thermaerobacter sp. PB12/4term]
MPRLARHNIVVLVLLTVLTVVFGINGDIQAATYRYLAITGIKQKNLNGVGQQLQGRLHSMS